MGEAFQSLIYQRKINLQEVWPQPQGDCQERKNAVPASPRNGTGILRKKRSFVPHVIQSRESLRGRTWRGPCRRQGDGSRLDGCTTCVRVNEARSARPPHLDRQAGFPRDVAESNQLSRGCRLGHPPPSPSPPSDCRQEARAGGQLAFPRMHGGPPGAGLPPRGVRMPLRLLISQEGVAVTRPSCPRSGAAAALQGPSRLVCHSAAGSGGGVRTESGGLSPRGRRRHHRGHHGDRRVTGRECVPATHCPSMVTPSAPSAHRADDKT